MLELREFTWNPLRVPQRRFLYKWCLLVGLWSCAAEQGYRGHHTNQGGFSFRRQSNQGDCCDYICAPNASHFLCGIATKTSQLVACQQASLHKIVENPGTREVSILILPHTHTHAHKPRRAHVRGTTRSPEVIGVVLAEVGNALPASVSAQMRASDPTSGQINREHGKRPEVPLSNWDSTTQPIISPDATNRERGLWFLKGTQPYMEFSQVKCQTKYVSLKSKPSKTT